MTEVKEVQTEQALREVQSSLESIVCDETAKVGTMSIGDVVRQGDLYLVCISTPKENVLIKKTNQRQLAPGPTQGSRHCLKGNCEIYECGTWEAQSGIIEQINNDCPSTEAHFIPERDRTLIGPVFKTLSEVEVTHPEHGHRILPQGEWFVVVYQRALADTVRRQLD